MCCVHWKAQKEAETQYRHQDDIGNELALEDCDLTFVTWTLSETNLEYRVLNVCNIHTVYLKAPFALSKHRLLLHYTI
jgi:hypothetical protein